MTLSDSDQLARVDPRGGKPATFADGPRARPASRCARASCGSPTAPSSTLTRIDIRTRRRSGAEIPVPQNPYDVAAYGDAIWVTSLAEGKIARVTGLDG